MDDSHQVGPLEAQLGSRRLFAGTASCQQREHRRTGQDQEPRAPHSFAPSRRDRSGAE